MQYPLGAIFSNQEKGSTLLLGEPAPTPYDLHFSIFGFPVRISAWFWLAGLIFGSSITGWADELNIPAWRCVLAWIAPLFVSILIHELGHCLAFRKHNLSSRMVLYHFGGLAIPGSRLGHRSTSQTPWSQVEISAAGPVLQMISGLLLGIVVRTFGFNVPGLPSFLSSFLPMFNSEAGRDLRMFSGDLYLFVDSYMYISIYWALFNLLPIYPLDGGQIARQLGVIAFGTEGVRYSLILSIMVGGLVAVGFFTSERNLMAFMFASFAYSSYQALQSSRGSYRPW